MQPLLIDEIVKIQPKGLFTIPVKARKQLFQNNLARVRIDRGRLIVEPVRILDYPVRQYSEEEIDEFFAKDDQDSQTLRKKDFL